MVFSSRFGIRNITAMCLTALSLIYSHQVFAQTNLGPVPLGKPGEEVKAAKETLRRMSQTKDFLQATEFFSHETSATFAIFMMIPLSMASGMQDMGEAMGKSFPDSNAGKNAKIPKKDRITKAEVDAVTKKYGLDSDKDMTPAQEARFKKNGRAMLQDILKLLNRLDDARKSNKDGLKNINDNLKEMDHYVYTRVSATEVKIKTTKKDDQPAKVIVEDGKWRYHFISLDDLNKRKSPKAHSKLKKPSKRNP